MEDGARIIASFGLALSAGLVATALLFLMTGKRPHRRLFSEPNPGASGLAMVCSGICGCVITGTIATGWTTSYPLVTMAIGGPLWLFSFVSSVIFWRKARVAEC
jgi:hypothetical protein